MARSIPFKPHTKPADAVDLYGNLLDKTPTTAGTKVNALLLADSAVFFAKLMAEAGITHNELPENFTNGFQFYDALAKLMGINPTVFTVGSGVGGAPAFLGTNLASAVSGNSLKYYKIGKVVTLEGSWRYNKATSGTDVVCTLPAGYRPAQLSQRYPLIDGEDFTYKQGGLLITSAGNVAFENPGGSIGTPEMFIGSIRFLTP